MTLIFKPYRYQGRYWYKPLNDHAITLAKLKGSKRFTLAEIDMLNKNTYNITILPE